MMIPDGKTRWAAVVASPIEHSLSPLIHNTAFQSLGINATYLAFDVSEEELEDAFSGLKAFKGLGFNLSMPNKQEALKYVDCVSEEARLIGAVNTVVNSEGSLTGYNTDGIGFIKSLESEQVFVTDKKVTVLGSGGAGLSIIVALTLSDVKKITVFKRPNDNFEEVSDKLQYIAQQTGCEIELLAFGCETLLTDTIATSDILVNTTNVGMGEGSTDTLVKETSCLTPSSVVVDIIYNPKETQLLEDAKSKGCQTINGLGMLIYQAAEAFKLWTGQDMPVEDVKKAILEHERNL